MASGIGRGAFGRAVLCACVFGLLLLPLAGCGGGGGGGGSTPAPQPPAPTNQAGTVRIVGTATQHQRLTAEVQDGNDVPDVINYQWLANGNAIDGATASSLLLAQAHVGYAISVRASYTDRAGFSESVTSTATAAVADVQDKPELALAYSGVSIVDFSKRHDIASGVNVQADGKVLVAGTSILGNEQGLTLARLNADGSMDTSFGVGGKATLQYRGNGGRFYSRPHVDAQGRIAVAGYILDFYSGQRFMVVARFNPDGSPDGSFSGGGSSYAGPGVAVVPATVTSEVRAMAVDAQGRYVLAGRNGTFGGQIMLVRLLQDGRLDSSFGEDGYLILPQRGPDEFASDVVIDGQGRIVVVARERQNMVAMRFSSEGRPDTSFGDLNGTRILFAGGFRESAHRVVLDSQGRIVVAGESDGGGRGADFFLARLLGNGQPDTGFGDGGVVLTDFNGYNDAAFGIEIDDVGRIVVAGYASGVVEQGRRNYAIARHLPNGQLDTGYGEGGRVQVDVGGYEDSGAALRLDAQGRAIVAGWSVDQGAGYSSDFGVVRLLADGSRDPGFGERRAVHIQSSPGDVLAPTAQVRDGDVLADGSYVGHRLEIRRIDGASGDDLFFADGSAQTRADGAVVVDGVPVGTYSMNAGVFSVQFGAQASIQRVDALLRNIRYRNLGNNPAGFTTRLQWSWTDETGLQSVQQMELRYNDDNADVGDSQLDLRNGLVLRYPVKSDDHHFYLSSSADSWLNFNRQVHGGDLVPGPIQGRSWNPTWRADTTNSRVLMAWPSLEEVLALRAQTLPSQYRMARVWATSFPNLNQQYIVDLSDGSYRVAGTGESAQGLFMVWPPGRY